MSIRFDHGLTHEQVAANLEKTAPVRARLTAIENELFSRPAYLPNHILRPLDPQARLAHEKYFELLRTEREHLLSQLPQTGEASGQHLATNRTIGTTYVRESVQEPWSRDDDYDASDPHQRFAREMGWSIE